MDELARRIEAFILDDSAADSFEALALALFERQYRIIEPYRRLCDSHGVTPTTCKNWTAIPLAPVAAFKLFELSCVPVEQARVVYHSSGTTSGETSRHYMDNDALALYRTSLTLGFAHAIPEARGKPIWALMPPPKHAPNSSLSAMLEMLRADQFYWEADGQLIADLRAATQPIVLFGTAFAFVQLFDALDTPISLPSGSIIIETGGFKGRSREVPRSELYSWFSKRLRVGESMCFSEYGMSEMASQFYSRGLADVKFGNRWVRTRIIDPITGQDVASDERGLLAHYDLANFNSLMAIQTEDAGRFVTGDGFVLLGRAAEAELRGCSLTAEELWTKRQSQ